MTSDPESRSQEQAATEAAAAHDTPNSPPADVDLTGTAGAELQTASQIPVHAGAAAQTDESGAAAQTDESGAAAQADESGAAAQAPDTVEVILKNRRAQPFYGRHPWVFAGAIDKFQIPEGYEGEPGSHVRLVTADRRFIAYGLLNRNSRIQVRLYSWNEAEPVDEELLRQLIRRAVQGRRLLFDLMSESVACRLIFSESDGLSGLIVDYYGGYLLVQFSSLAIFRYRDAIVAALQSELHPKGIWLRTEKGMREAEGLEVSDGLISGKEPPRPLFIEEHGVQYGVDVQQGQKTGCFIDQRDNRLAVSRYVRGARVLDAFCYSGGFGITSLVRGQAAGVVGIDSSESALTLAAANAELNGVADRCQWIRGDVRPEIQNLAQQGRAFDVVIVDPPRMARSRGGIDRAIQGYANLNRDALTVLKPGGILVSCSCSGLVGRDDFQEMLADTARQSHRDIQILESLGQPADHPVSVTCPETSYLKTLICRVW